MNKRRIISLSITAVSVAVSLIIFFQLLPYLNLRYCKVTQTMGFSGINITVVNPTNKSAKFPTMTLQIYRGSTFLGNGTITGFDIPPHSNVTKSIPFTVNVTLAELPKLLSSNTTTVKGTVYIPILSFNLPIKYKIVNNGSTSTLYVLGRKVVLG